MAVGYEGRVFYQAVLATYLCLLIGLYLTIPVECDTMLIRYTGFKVMTVERLGGDIMKKVLGILLAVVYGVGLVGCGSVKDLRIDYGTSDIYTQEDMDAAIDVILKEFDTWDGCEMHSISYEGDDSRNEENIEWLNDLKKNHDEGEVFTQCIGFTSNFHSSKDGGEGWNEDFEYTNWQWWLARSEGGEWKLMTWGYG